MPNVGEKEFLLTFPLNISLLPKALVVVLGEIFLPVVL